MVSRNLIVIPRSLPLVAVYSPPKCRMSFVVELERYVRKPSSRVPPEFLRGTSQFISELAPKEIETLVLFLTKRSSPDANIKKELIKRVVDIGHNISLTCLVKIYHLIPSRIIESVLSDRLSSETAKTLRLSDLISLFDVRSVKHSVVAHEAARHLSSANLYELATIANKIRKLGESGPSVERLSDLVANRSVSLLSDHSVKGRDLALLANGFSREGHRSSSLLASVVEACMRLDRSNFSPASFALILHSLAKSDHFDTRLFDVFATDIIKSLSKFRAEPHSVGMVLYSYGKVGIKNDALLHAFSDLVKRDVQQYPCKSLAMVVYGFSKLRFVERELWTIFVDEVVYRGTVKRYCKKFKWTYLDIGMLSKGFSRASLNPKDSEKISWVLFEIMKRLRNDSGSATSVCELMDGIARLDRSRIDGGLLFWISKTIPVRISQCTPTEVYSVLTSLWKMGVRNDHVNECLVKECDKISNVPLRIKCFYTLSKMKVFSDTFTKVSAKLISANLGSLSMEELIKTLYAFSEMNYLNSDLNSRVIQATIHQFKSGSIDLIDNQMLAMLIVASARLRISDEILYDSLMKTLFERVKDIQNEQTVCNVLFSMATALGSEDWSDEYRWFNSVASALLNQIRSQKNLPVEGIRQLQVFDLFSKMRNLDISSELLDDIGTIDTFKSAVPSIEQSSKTHREVSKYLTKLGFSHRNEVTIGPFSLDIYSPDQKIIVEIDGPHHFFRDTNIRTSSSILKHKILEHLGYQIVHVPYQEWAQCTSDLKKLVYCADLAERMNRI
jgi:very-short-patch-repair endonuclease